MSLDEAMKASIKELAERAIFALGAGRCCRTDPPSTGDKVLVWWPARRRITGLAAGEIIGGGFMISRFSDCSREWDWSGVGPETPDWGYDYAGPSEWWPLPTPKDQGHG